MSSPKVDRPESEYAQLAAECSELSAAAWNDDCAQKNYNVVVDEARAALARAKETR